MHLPSSHVFETLRDKGVTELHHANSVATACQFIRRRSLLSRGSVERLGITQTPQISDDADKRYSIWFDVFLDSVDIHKRASRANIYGPVLFVLDIGIIDRNSTGKIWVTKLNPTKWAGQSESQRWFKDKTDLVNNFVKGCFDQMLVLRHCGGSLPFGSYLKNIILDDPYQKTKDKIDIYSMSVGALRLAMGDANINVPIHRRKCTNGCVCRDDWSENNQRLLQMFNPKI